MAPREISTDSPNPSRIWDGGWVSTAPLAGSVDSRLAWADAGPASSRRDATVTTRPTRTARGRRTPPFHTIEKSLLGRRWFPIELEGEGVHAEALARGRRAVVEDVAQVRTAPLAPHLGAGHAVAPVGDELDGVT